MDFVQGVADLASRARSLFKKKEIPAIKIEDKPKPIAENSNYFLLQQGGKTTSYICPNFSFSLEGEKDDLTLTLYFNFPPLEVAEGQPAFVCVDYTNDPTPAVAGYVCSLGYYLLRIQFNRSELKQEPNKLILKGKKDDFSIYINRPQREIYAPLPSAIQFDYLKYKDSKFHMAYIFQHSNWSPVFVINLLEGEKYVVIEDYLDLRSFYSNQTSFTSKEFETKEEAVSFYNDRVNHYSRNLKEEFKPCI